MAVADSVIALEVRKRSVRVQVLQANLDKIRDLIEERGAE
jgi:hypothetical protein